MSSKVLKLDDIASISSGLVAKRKQAVNEKEIRMQYSLLTLKSFDQGGWLNRSELEYFDSNEILNKKYLTQKGDVILRLSNPNTAISISEENVGIIIPSLFAVIRIDTKEVLPEYLSIFLNSEYMKKIYVKSSVGSAIQIIKTSMLKDIEVSVKSIETQVKIIEINNLITREKVLIEKLLVEKIKYNNAILSKLMND